MPGGADIAKAPVSMPQPPTGPFTAVTLAAPPEAFSGTIATPRVVVTLKPDPAKALVVTERTAKPFVPDATTKAATKPVGKRAAQPSNKPKPFKPAPGPLDQVLDFFTPLTSNGGKAPSVPSGNRR